MVNENVSELAEALRASCREIKIIGDYANVVVKNYPKALEMAFMSDSFALSHPGVAAQGVLQAERLKGMVKGRYHARRYKITSYNEGELVIGLEN